MQWFGWLIQPLQLKGHVQIKKDGLNITHYPSQLQVNCQSDYSICITDHMIFTQY